MTKFKNELAINLTLSMNCNMQDMLIVTSSPFLSILVTSFPIGTVKFMCFSVFSPQQVNCFSTLSQSDVFFFYLGFLLQQFTNHRTAVEGGGHFLTPRYHFHPLHRQLDISQTITTKSSTLHIGSSQTRTRNLWFPSASC